MRLVRRMKPALAFVVLWAVGASAAQDGLTKQDRRGPVTVAVTLTALPEVGAPVRAKVALDTHSVALDGIAFDQVVSLRTNEGRDVAPVAIEEVKGGGHHRQAVLVFPPLAAAGPLKIVVKDVGGVAEREFVWEP